MLAFFFHLSQDMISASSLQIYPRSIPRQLNPEQHKRPLPPVRPGRKRLTERKLIIREVEKSIARNRHCRIR